MFDGSVTGSRHDAASFQKKLLTSDASSLHIHCLSFHVAGVVMSDLHHCFMMFHVCMYVCM